MADVARWECPAEEYFASPAVSRSRLEIFMRSAALYAANVPIKETAALRWGRLVHLRVLEPRLFRATTHKWNPPKINRRYAAGKREWKLIDAEREALVASGFILITPEEAARLEAIVGALAAHDLARKMIEQYDREVSYTWTDDATGIACRARLDLHTLGRGGVVTDLKSTDDPSPEAFGKSAGKYGYHRQGAFYSRPIRELTGEFPRVNFIAVRSSYPHEVAVHPLNPEHRLAGDRQIDDALKQMARCAETNDWSSPWQARAAKYLPIPNWALK